VHAVLTRALLELEPAVVAPGLASSARESAEVDADHRRIAEAIAARRPEAAGAAMASHLHGVRCTLEARAAAGAGHLVAGAR
jgi:DNA-binding FadR family transcriptional regulator